MKAGWEVKTLGDLFDVKSSKRVHQSDWKSSGIPFYRAREVVKLAKDGCVINELFISEELYNEFIREKGAPKAGDIIISAVGTLGQCYLVKATDKFYFKDASVLWLENISNVNSRYIEFSFMSNQITEQVMEGSMGATVGTLTISRAKDIQIPLPPLPEQPRIVALLDEAFAAIDKAKANAEQNLKNTKELFESYLQSIFENKGEGWEEKEFGSVITTLTDYHANGSYEVLKENVELKDTEDYAWMVRSTDFENNFKNSFRYIDKNSYEFLKKSKVFGGEIIMSKIGNAGNVYLMPKSNRPCSLAMNLFLIRIDEKVAIPEFIYQYLISKKGEIQIKSRLLGMATKTITKDNVRNIVIPFPSLPEQQAIVQKLDALSANTKQLETIYQQKINDLDELKKSILQKAFAGELNTNTLVT